ncbi:MAG: hypothetical protein Q4D81_01400 [Eubacteriales bacterium]|nr:hypothetical protein [Eubacteriales bacterium]
MSRGIRIVKEPLGGCYAICCSPYAASLVETPVYLGGSITDLSGKTRDAAADGYIYAVQHGIREIERWKEDYLDYFRDHNIRYIDRAKKNRDVLLFLAREWLRELGFVNCFLNRRLNSNDVELKAALLQLQNKLKEDPQSPA